MSFLLTKTPGSLNPGVNRPILLEPWTPAELGDALLAWYDPTSGTDGATVTSWTDKSTRARHGNVIVGAPTYDADGLDGTPAVAFNGSSSIKTATFAGPTTGSPFTLIVNGKATGSGTQYFVDGSTSNGMGIYRSVSGNTFGSRRTTATGITRSPSDGLAHSFISVFNGANSRFYVDGVATAGEQGTISPSVVTIGTNGGATSPLTGFVGDILWVSGALDDITCLRISTWLKSRRGAVA